MKSQGTGIIHAYITQKDFSHHAHVIEATGEYARACHTLLLEVAPDAHVIEAESLLIDDVRELQRRQQLHAVSGGRKVFVVHVGSIQHEAQHALLKLIEEPTEKTHFFFILPSIALLLPTVLSRLLYLGAYNGKNDGGSASGAHNELVAQFVAASVPERLKLTAFLYEEEPPRGGRQAVVEFVYALLEAFRARIRIGHKGDAEVYGRCMAMAHYASDKASSSKMIVEYLAFLIP